MQTVKTCMSHQDHSLGKRWQTLMRADIPMKTLPIMLSWAKKGKSLPKANVNNRKPLPRITRPYQKKKQDAGVKEEDMQESQASVFDFLTKYCIIKPERLLFYERIFQKYAGIKESLDMEKIHFQMDYLVEKEEHILSRIQDLQDQRLQLMEAAAKHKFPKVTRAFPKMSDAKCQGEVEEMKNVKQVQKGWRASRQGNQNHVQLSWDSHSKNTRGSETNTTTTTPLTLPLLTNKPNQVSLRIDIDQLDLMIDHLKAKYKEIQSRISALEETRVRLEDKHKEESLQRFVPNCEALLEGRRLQSALYHRLHPKKDPEICLNDLEAALKEVNSCLLTPHEYRYIYHILELPGKQRLNFGLFSVVAALSEKVSQLDPMIKKLINKLDYEALSVRVEKTKELWHLLQEEREQEIQTNRQTGGTVSIHSLAVELAAGGFSLESINFALQKFNRFGAGVMSFEDFVTYIPLFVEIHRTIIENPLHVNSSSIFDLEDS